MAVWSHLKNCSQISVSRQRVLKSGVPPILGPVLSNIHVVDMESEIECTISRFIDSPNICSSTGWKEAIQRDFDRFQRRTYVNLMKFNKASAMACMWVRAIPVTNPKLARKLIESSSAEKGLDV